jgi:hypothetical protein
MSKKYIDATIEAKALSRLAIDGWIELLPTKIKVIINGNYIYPDIILKNRQVSPNPVDYKNTDYRYEVGVYKYIDDSSGWRSEEKIDYVTSVEFENKVDAVAYYYSYNRNNYFVMLWVYKSTINDMISKVKNTIQSDITDEDKYKQALAIVYDMIFIKANDGGNNISSTRNSNNTSYPFWLLEKTGKIALPYNDMLGIKKNIGEDVFIAIDYVSSGLFAPIGEKGVAGAKYSGYSYPYCNKGSFPKALFIWNQSLNISWKKYDKEGKEIGVEEYTIKDDAVEYLTTLGNYSASITKYNMFVKEEEKNSDIYTDYGQRGGENYHQTSYSKIKYRNKVLSRGWNYDAMEEEIGYEVISPLPMIPIDNGDVFLSNEPTGDAYIKIVDKYDNITFVLTSYINGGVIYYINIRQVYNGKKYYAENLGYVEVNYEYTKDTDKYTVSDPYDYRPFIETVTEAINKDIDKYKDKESVYRLIEGKRNKEPYYVINAKGKKNTLNEDRIRKVLESGAIEDLSGYVTSAIIIKGGDGYYMTSSATIDNLEQGLGYLISFKITDKREKSISYGHVMTFTFDLQYAPEFYYKLYKSKVISKEQMLYGIKQNAVISGDKSLFHDNMLSSGLFFDDDKFKSRQGRNYEIREMRIEPAYRID